MLLCAALCGLVQINRAKLDGVEQILLLLLDSLYLAVNFVDAFLLIVFG